MSSHKVFSNQQIKWQEGEGTRLNYQMLFQEKKQEEEKLQFDSEELLARLNQRDQKWKKRLKQEKEKAYQEGFAAGQIEGEEKADGKIDSKIKVIKSAIAQGHQEWRERQQLIEPGVLDLAFEVCEAILGLPLVRDELTQNLEEQLVPIFRKLDRESRPIIKVSNDDLEFVQRLKDKHVPEMTMYIEADEGCNPGEFELDTDQETIVHKFREMLKEFKKNLSLPTWN